MRGRDTFDDERPDERPAFLIVTDKVEVAPALLDSTDQARNRTQPVKRPDYTHRPRGAALWALVVPLILAEIVALKLDVEWTLSRTVWWILGPAYEPRWWLVGFPLWALLAWTGPHFLWPNVFTGWVLTVIVAVALVAAGIGTVLTLH